MLVKWTFALLLGLASAGAASAQTIVYVNQANTSPTQNGRSWTTAYAEIQTGIEAAREAFGGEVWVAAGTYGEDRDNAGALRLRAGVNVYGGFAGDEAVRDQRDPAANLTTIDASTSAGGEPAATAILGATNSVIDGFTIRGASGQDGAGMTNISVSPTVVNCTFTENSASRFGGAVLNVGGATPAFRNCTFLKNHAGDSGGAIANTGAVPSVQNCKFIQNDAVNVGGGVFNVEQGDVFLSGSLFDGNTAGNGGGAIFNEKASPSISACKFFRNTTLKFGGAIFNNNGSSPLVVNCVFARNAAGDRGGVATTLDSYFTAINCTIAYNESTNGGSVLFDNNAQTTIFNSILWYNQTSLYFTLGSTTEIHDSNVGGGQSGTGNIAVEPQFTDAAHDDFSIKSTSPSIDAGTQNGAPSTDINGITRPKGDGIDQGAYESEIVLPPTDNLQCPAITLSTRPAGPPAPGTLLILATMAAVLLFSRPRAVHVRA